MEHASGEDPTQPTGVRVIRRSQQVKGTSTNHLTYYPEGIRGALLQSYKFIGA